MQARLGHRRPGAALAALAAASVLCLASTAAAQWGTVKGQAVWAGDVVPKNEDANVNKDKPQCLAKGPIKQNKYVINDKNKGVRWVMVWLADPQDATRANFAPPIHPKLKNPAKTVDIDQPCCTFEPRVIGIEAKEQTLVVKNSMGIAHNFAISSIGPGPNANPLIPPGQQAEVKGFVPKLIPTPYSCSIHPWMKGYIATFAHPYFAVTDKDGNFEIKNAPVGKFQLVAWQEESGFLLQANIKNKQMRGKAITIKADETTDVGKVGVKPSDD